MPSSFKPICRDGVCVNGCLPLTAATRRLQEECLDSAVSLPEYAWQNKGDMPIVKWDAAFDRWLDRRIKLADAYADRGKCLLPWEIMKVIPEKRKRSNILNWNQGTRPSCALHGATHAYQNMTLLSMALGAPLIYEALNPIYPFYLAKRGSMAGGLDLITTAKWCNEHGQYPASLIGDDNVNVSGDYKKHAQDAKRWQAGIVFIEGDVKEKVIRACHGLCSVNFGSGHYFRSSKTDRSGVKIMDGYAGGGHAQCFVGYRKVGNAVYIGTENSHGNSYASSPEGEPRWMAWINESQISGFCSDAPNFGHPYIVFVEGDFAEEPQLYNDFDLPDFPKNWIN